MNTVNQTSLTLVTLVTRGSRGVGAATARLAATHGYDVAISVVSNASAALAVVADVQAADRRGLAVYVWLDPEDGALNHMPPGKLHPFNPTGSAAG